MFDTIVSPEELEPLLGNHDLAVVDARFDLADSHAGREAYLASHIAGAVFADLERDLSAPRGPGDGRHPLPDLDALERLFGRLGVDERVQLVVYDAHDGMYASRLWWMSKYLGHDAVAVLDGGFARWIDEGRPTRGGEEGRPPRRFEARPRPSMIADAGEVDRARLDPRRVVVDSRAPDRFRGENETIDSVAGHIPGAKNHFFKSNTDAKGRLRSAEELRASFAPTLGDVDPTDAIVYCGSGVTACQNLLALARAGLDGAKLYPGSWSEWIADGTRPVATGGEKR